MERKNKICEFTQQASKQIHITSDNPRLSCLLKHPNQYALNC